jgi:small subunit ribosomal protein S6
MMERYRAMIEGAGGRIHRQEDWGRRQLAHSIAKLHKAHYLLLNVECDKPALDELIGSFRFSDAVLRYLVIKRDKAITEPSIMAKAQEEEKAREAQAASRSSRRDDDSRGKERTEAEGTERRAAAGGESAEDGQEDDGEGEAEKPAASAERTGEESA